MLGEFNAYNLACAFVCTLKLVDVNISSIAKALKSFEGIAGRLERVSSEPFVVIDFAHTEDGIEAVLKSMQIYEKKLVVVFGAGGDRDKSKRSLMGACVDKFSDRVIITSDNPRSENPYKIIEDIKEGFKDKSKVIEQVDRKKAIKYALKTLKNDEILLILGKGDEKVQIFDGYEVAFNDKEEVLNNLKY